MWWTFTNICADFCVTTKKRVQPHYVLVCCRNFNMNLERQKLHFIYLFTYFLVYLTKIGLTLDSKWAARWLAGLRKGKKFQCGRNIQHHVDWISTQVTFCTCSLCDGAAVQCWASFVPINNLPQWRFANDGRQSGRCVDISWLVVGLPEGRGGGGGRSANAASTTRCLRLH